MLLFPCHWSDSTRGKLGAAFDACCTTMSAAEDATCHLERFTFSCLQQSHVMCTTFLINGNLQCLVLVCFPFLAMDGGVQAQKFLALEKEENCDYFYLRLVFVPQDVKSKKVSGEVTHVT